MSTKILVAVKQVAALDADFEIRADGKDVDADFLIRDLNEWDDFALEEAVKIKEAAAEPPAVVRARAFVTEHLGEHLSLAVVAQAAHMSAFYFCKVFKAATGLTFTDYVSRARVEKAKQLMLNPHTRVSEAAYEAGFQSLSQFNRVFRRTVGEAPSAYRHRLHSTTSSSALACAA